MDSLLQRVSDPNLRFSLGFGIGLHHAGLGDRDRRIVEELFVNQKIHVRLVLKASAKTLLQNGGGKGGEG